MEHQEVINNLRTGLAFILEKSGSSLEEFEALLQNENHKEAMEKMAAAGAGAVGLATALALKAPEFALILSAMGGVLAGGAAHATDLYTTSQDRRLDEKREEIDHINRAKLKLKADYGL